MKNREKLTRLVVEKIWGIPFVEAIKNEDIAVIKGTCARCSSELSELCRTKRWCHKCEEYTFVKEKYLYKPYPIKIARIMQALGKVEFKNEMDSIIFTSNNGNCYIMIESGDYYTSSTYNEVCEWQLLHKGKDVDLNTKEEGEYIISEETVLKLINLLTK